MSSSTILCVVYVICFCQVTQCLPARKKGNLNNVLTGFTNLIDLSKDYIEETRKTTPPPVLPFPTGPVTQRPDITFGCFEKCQKEKRLHKLLKEMHGAKDKMNRSLSQFDRTLTRTEKNRRSLQTTPVTTTATTKTKANDWLYQLVLTRRKTMGFDYGSRTRFFGLSYQ